MKAVAKLTPPVGRTRSSRAPAQANHGMGEGLRAPAQAPGVRANEQAQGPRRSPRPRLSAAERGLPGGTSATYFCDACSDLPALASPSPSTMACSAVIPHCISEL